MVFPAQEARIIYTSFDEISFCSTAYIINNLKFKTHGNINLVFIMKIVFIMKMKFDFEKKI